MRANKVPGGLEVFDETCARHVLLAGVAGLFTDVFGLRIRGGRGASGRGVRRRADYWRSRGRCGLVWNLGESLTRRWGDSSKDGNDRKQDYPKDPVTGDHQHVFLFTFGGSPAIRRWLMLHRLTHVYCPLSHSFDHNLTQ